jgi:uncharacterized membrane protein YcaP (DUF421 family)
MLARAVNGNAAFVPTLGGGFVLAVLHRLLAYWSRRSHAFGFLIKGRSEVIVRDGKLDDAVASRNRLSEHDILEDVRLNGNLAVQQRFERRLQTAKVPCLVAVGRSPWPC